MNVLAILGIAICLIGGIGLLIAAFRVGVFWGICCLLIAPASILFIVMHWQDAKNPFFLQLIGVVILLIVAVFGGNVGPVA
ncbi:hypothetical protein E4634_21225 [Mangrovimicrobium sediminis]|uniref:Uncharacterized protein n=1 Tax=Mangrovimicrobium sediminis TaxID=2562682 RepID=A0A4Z0LSP4_9GAMM|nr:hypothetical protein [Haliea sp. SAOS-164]TGD70284.1 hypothetical protein E4634_21225 [Haliea sp. SAOS-164]